MKHILHQEKEQEEIKAYTEKELDSFWDEYKRLDQPHVYKVDLSDKLYELKTEMLDKIRGRSVEI